MENKRRNWRYPLSMGSERASTARQIRSGELCALCKRRLPPPLRPGEQLCSNCRAARGKHRVYMSFVAGDCWCCQFIEDDLKTPLPRVLRFRSPDKIREMANRGGCGSNLETLQGLEHAITLGRGGVWLELSEEQYRKLKEGRSNPRITG